MVPGRSHRGERAARPTLHHRIHPGHRGARRAQRGLGAAGAHRGIGVELHALAFGGADRQDRIDVIRRMHARKLLGGGVRRGLAQQVGELGRLQRSEDGAQPVGTLRMIRTVVVAEAGRVGDQCYGHVSPSAPVPRHDGE